MPEFTYDAAGQTAHITVPDELAAFHRADPKYTEVTVDLDGEYVPVDEAEAEREQQAERAEVEQQVADLAGDKLDAAVKAAKIAHPSALTAEEKRAALVEQKLAGDQSGDAGDTTEEK